MPTKRSEFPDQQNLRLARLLRRRVDSMVDVETVARRAHWEAQGPNHIALHGLFDQISTNMDAHVTELAIVIKELRRKLHRSQTKVARLGNAHASAACDGLVRDVDKYCQALKTLLHPAH